MLQKLLNLVPHRPSATHQAKNGNGHRERGILVSGSGLTSPNSDPSLATYYAKSTPVYAAINIRSKAVSRPALVLSDQGQTPQPVRPHHPALQYLNDPATFSTTSHILALTEAHLNIWGVAYWLPRSVPTPHVKVLHPAVTTPQVNNQDEITGFAHSRHGMRHYAPEEVIYFRSLNPDNPLSGMGPMTPATLPTQSATKAGEYNSAFYQNAARPDFILLSDEPLPQNIIDQFYANWEKRFTGIANAHRPAIASQIREAVAMGITHVDMDFLNSLKWSLEEVARAFEIPKTMLGDLERATFTNFVSSERIFWRGTVVPRLEYIQQELNNQFLPKIGFPDLYFNFDLSTVEALNDNSHEAAERDALLLDQGVVTINEIRAARNLPPVPWGNEPWPERGSAASSRTRETVRDN